MKINSFTTGLITGAVIGAAAGIIMDPMNDKASKNMRNTCKGTFRTVGSVIDNFISN